MATAFRKNHGRENFPYYSSEKNFHLVHFLVRVDQLISPFIEKYNLCLVDQSLYNNDNGRGKSQGTLLTLTSRGGVARLKFSHPNNVMQAKLNIDTYFISITDSK